MHTYDRCRQMFYVIWRFARKPIGRSIALHLLVIIGLVYATPIEHISHPSFIELAPTQSIVHAQMVDAKAYDRQQAARRAAAHAEQQRLARIRAKQLAKQRATEAARKAALAKKAALKKQKMAEQKRKAAQEKQRKLAEKKQQEMRKKQDQAKQKAIAEQLKAQALSSLKQHMKASKARQAAEQQRLTEKDKYVGLIQQSIRAHWINQYQDEQNLRVVLLISVNAQGDVQSVKVTEPSGNPAFDRQAILAVKKSSPLPLPKDESLAKQFQVIKLPFSNSTA